MSREQGDKEEGDKEEGDKEEGEQVDGKQEYEQRAGGIKRRVRIGVNKNR